MPRISVIIPAYNAGGCIMKSARSVLAQDAELELIIVDDGSKDDTAQLCAALAAEDGRVRVISLENGGVSRARNTGMDAAQGEYIAFVDADDYLEPDAYKKLLDAIERTGADCAMCGHYRLYPDGRRETDPPPFADGLVKYPEIRDRLLLPLLADRVSAELVLGTVWRYLFRRDRIEELGIRFSGAYLEDEMFLIEYFARETDLACVREGLYAYYQNPASVTRRYLADFCETFRRSAEKKRELVERYAIPAPSGWTDNTAWAGLLIAASNEFAPGSPGGLFRKAARLREICAMPMFSRAIASGVPEGMNRNKSIVASLLRRRLYLPLAGLYMYKNRNRK